MVATIIVAFVAGSFGAFLVTQLDRGGAAGPTSAMAAPAQQKLITATEIRLLDGAGRVRAELALAGDGDPALFFFDREGRNRMNLGLYSPSEGELPFIVLNDTNLRAAGIFRLFGPKQTPVVVFKHEGQDRSIYGLNPTSTDPFIVNMAPGGSKTHVFGNW
jgi:hypothetical protein